MRILHTLSQLFRHSSVKKDDKNIRINTNSVNKNINNNKFSLYSHTHQGFSMMDTLVSFLIISIIAAAFVPVVIKKVSHNSVKLKTGSAMSKVCSNSCKLCLNGKCYLCPIRCDSPLYKDRASCSCIDCSETDENCNKCTLDEDGETKVCTSCKQGYALDEDENGIKRCWECEPGNYCENGEENPCPKGTYQDQAGQFECKSCEAGTYQDEEGQTQCKPCDGGYYCNDDGAKNKKECDAGTYTPADGQPHTSCLTCPDEPEKTYSEAGASECHTCASKTPHCVDCVKAGGRCIDCEEGYHRNVLTHTCNNCSQNYYLSSNSPRTCTACPDDKTTPENNELTVCGACDPNCAEGFCNDSGQCSKCSDGYNLVNGVCVSSCPAHCTACSGNTCTSCEAGYGLNNGSCELCPAGKYSPGGTSACIGCSFPGYYQDAPGQTECLPCSNKVEHCTSCNQSSGTCWECETGYYINNMSVPEPYECKNQCPENWTHFATGAGTPYSPYHDFCAYSKHDFADTPHVIYVNVSTNTAYFVESNGAHHNANSMSCHHLPCCWIGVTASNCTGTGCSQTLCNVEGVEETCNYLYAYPADGDVYRAIVKMGANTIIAANMCGECGSAQLCYETKYPLLCRGSARDEKCHPSEYHYHTYVQNASFSRMYEVYNLFENTVRHVLTEYDGDLHGDNYSSARNFRCVQDAKYLRTKAQYLPAITFSK